MATAAITGTVGDGATESEIVAGDGTIIITLTGDTWIASGETYMLRWDCESVNAESSAGDSTATLTGVSITSFGGGNRLYNDGTASQQAAFTVAESSARDIVSEIEGRITFDLYLVSNISENNHWAFRVGNTGADELSIRLYWSGTTNELILRWLRDGGADRSAETTASLSTGAWYAVDAKWKYGGSPYTLSITVNSTTATSGLSLDDAFNTAPTFLHFARTGASGSNAFYIDNIKIYADSGLT